MFDISFLIWSLSILKMVQGISVLNFEDASEPWLMKRDDKNKTEKYWLVVMKGRLLCKML